MKQIFSLEIPPRSVERSALGVWSGREKNKEVFSS